MLTIASESVDSQDARLLLEELSDMLERIAGSSGRASFDPSDMHAPRCVFAVAREDGVPVGCGAIRPFSQDIAELKRVYVREQGRGIGGRIVRFLEEQAKAFGYARLVLETRLRNENAVAFYLHNGYRRIENYGKYKGRPEAVCFEKAL